MRRLWDVLLDLLYPPRCCFCHNLMPTGVRLCEHCRETLPYTRGEAQLREVKGIEKCVSPLRYEKTVRESLLRYKFHSLCGYAQIYGDFLVKCIDENGISCDSITWVPLSRARRWTRGYDQAELLAREISRRTGLPCKRMLRKIRNNPAQSGIHGAAQRRENVKGKYRAVSPETIRGKRVLLVDDIVTTGSTLAECAAVLKAADAKAVCAVTVASTPREKK